MHRLFFLQPPMPTLSPLFNLELNLHSTLHASQMFARPPRTTASSALLRRDSAMLARVGEGHAPLPGRVILSHDLGSNLSCDIPGMQNRHCKVSSWISAGSLWCFKGASSSGVCYKFLQAKSFLVENMTTQHCSSRESWGYSRHMGWQRLLIQARSEGPNIYRHHVCKADPKPPSSPWKASRITKHFTFSGRITKPKALKLSSDIFQCTRDFAGLGLLLLA